MCRKYLALSYHKLQQSTLLTHPYSLHSVFYDMVKNGSSMGINVLSGLVKVERGEEAERSGLQGRRPLSVGIFTQ